MKKGLIKFIALALVTILCLGTLAACTPPDDTPAEETGDIVIGNTAGTTGALAAIGAPFNLGIQAAIAAYNADGGFNGRKVVFKTYDDGGVPENSLTYLDKLIYEDEVFAIVGNFGSYAVNVNLDTIKEEKVPMIYAAAGNNALLNENAQSAEDKVVFPVQPLNGTEGRMLILRAFAPTDKGGLGGTKVGVIANSNEASQALLQGIMAEAATLKAEQRDNIVVQNVASGDYTGAVNALKAAGCDVVVLTVIGADFVNALSTMANATYYCKVLTSYNNASATVFNDDKTIMQPQYEAIFSTMAIYTQAWLDISSTTYVYNADTPLNAAYKALYEGMGLPYNGQAGFSEDYWRVAEDIYDYVLTVDPTIAFAMSADAYALAGYIAGDLFCQGLEALEASGKPLTRENYVAIMESQEYQVAMADAISFANGMRSGVQSFSLTQFYDAYAVNGGAYHSAQSATVHGLTSIEDYRELLK